jgi:signal transduction histidine kinase
MSFRRRFALIACLVVAMVVMAGLALNQLRADRDSAREEAATLAGDGLLDALERHAVARGLDAETLRARLAADPRLVERVGCRGLQCDAFAARGVDSVVGSITESGVDPTATEVEAILAAAARSSGGYCAPDGALLIARSSRTGAPRARLLPADYDLANGVCARAGATAQVQHSQRAMPRDLLFAAARPIRTGLIAWSLTRLPPLSPGASRGRLLIEIAGMTLVCLLLVVLTLDGWRMLRRGTRDLETALLRLRGDLRAELPVPRASELARVADGLRAMASELADTRTREHELERRLGHEQRLAGLGRVVAGVAHEVRNPITGIKLKLDGLLRRELDERARADVMTCLGEIARLNRVVSSLLMVARTAPTDKQPLALEQLVDERIRQAEGFGAERGIALRRLGSARVDGNREALTAVIDNLLRNAVEASPTGGEVEVALTSEPRTARIEVRDRGDGIPAERLGELFEPFFTLKPTGTGLGLFLSRSLLTAQGATLDYRRDTGRTIFTVELP